MNVTTLAAQPQGRVNRENFNEFQIKLLIQQLEIDDSLQPKFEEIYAAYVNKMSSLRPARPKNPGGEQTDQEVEQQILESFEIAEQTTALKKEYYVLFKEVLTPQQILKMYNTERKINERLNSEAENRAKGQHPGQNRNQRNKTE